MAPLRGIIQILDQIPHSSLWHLYEELSRDLIRFLTLHSGTSTRNYRDLVRFLTLHSGTFTRNYPEIWSGSSLFTLAPLRGIIQRLDQVPHSSLWHLYEELSRDLSRFLILHSGPMHHWYYSSRTSPQHGPQSNLFAQ